jgi:hypothetical protein
VSRVVSPRRPYPPPPAADRVRVWEWNRRDKLRQRAGEIEREMRALVEGVAGKGRQQGFDPNALLDHPVIGADLLRLARAWVAVHAQIWGVDSHA